MLLCAAAEYKTVYATTERAPRQTGIKRLDTAPLRNINWFLTSGDNVLRYCANSRI